MENKYNELEKLNKLKANGTITDAEFEIEKSKILNNNGKKKNNNGLKLAVIICFIVGIVLFIITIAITIKHKQIFKEWDALPVYGDNGYGSTVERNLWNQVKNTEHIATGTLIISAITILAGSICQFIKSKSKKKGIIVLIVGIIATIAISVVYFFTNLY